MSVAEKTKTLVGVSLRLRPVEVSDAEIIISMRAGEDERFKYLNAITADVHTQREWIARQRSATDDYYFVIEDKFTSEVHGFIGVYNRVGNCAEWGRWILKKGSDASVESVKILMDFCFRNIGLDSVYSTTVAENTAVVRFHDSYAKRVENEVNDKIFLRGVEASVVKHALTKELYLNSVKAGWESLIMKLFSRLVRNVLGVFEFHHIGIACRSVEEASTGFVFAGYTEENRFTDPHQGVRGIFMTAKGQPRIELLENLENAKTLSSWSGFAVAPYHFAYKVDDLSASINTVAKLGLRQITPIKKSVYFGADIVFLLLPNRFMIELIGK